MRTTRTCALVVAGVVATSAFAAACGGSSDDEAKKADGPVTLTWWHNGTTAPLKDVWQQTAAGFQQGQSGRHDQGQADPERAVHDQGPGGAAVEQPARRLPAVGRRRAGHADRVRQGHGHHQAAGGRGRDDRLRAEGWQVDGKQYGVPFSLHVVGFWYRKDLFEKAGITAPPTTIDELNAAVEQAQGGRHRPDRDRRARTAGPTPSTGTTSPSATARPTRSSRR